MGFVTSLRGRVGHGAGAEVTLIDHEIEPFDASDPGASWRRLSWVELPDNTLLTMDEDGLWLRDGDGAPLRELERPGLACEVVGVEPDIELSAEGFVGGVLVSCADPAAVGTECWDAFGSGASRGLWQVPTDGSPAVELCVPGGAMCPEAYATALTIGGVTVMERAGCCECGGGLLFTDGASTWAWEPASVEVCNPRLVGVRNGAWLVVDGFSLPVLYEVIRGADPNRPRESTTALTPTGPGFGGVSNAIVVGA